MDLDARGATAGILRLLTRVLEAGVSPGALLWTVVVHQTPSKIGQGTATEFNLVVVHWNLATGKVLYTSLSECESELWKQFQRFSNIRWRLTDPAEKCRQPFRQRANLPPIAKGEVDGLMAAFHALLVAGKINGRADVEALLQQQKFKLQKKVRGYRGEPRWKCRSPSNAIIRLEGPAVQKHFYPGLLEARSIDRSADALKKERTQLEESASESARERGTGSQRAASPVGATKWDRVINASLQTAAATIRDLHCAIVRCEELIQQRSAKSNGLEAPVRGPLVLSGGAFWSFALEFLHQAQDAKSSPVYSRAEDYVYVIREGVCLAVWIDRLGSERVFLCKEFPDARTVDEASMQVQSLLLHGERFWGESLNADDLEIKIAEAKRAEQAGATKKTDIGQRAVTGRARA